MLELLVIPLTLLLLFSLLLWMIISLKGWWILKCGLTIFAVFASLCIWGIVSQLLGWPTTDELPQKYLLLWVHVDAPHSVYVQAIDLEATPPSKILGHPIDKSQPRLFKLPYSKELHKQAQGLLKELQKGRSIRMGRGAGMGQPGQSGRGGQGRSGGRDSQQGTGLMNLLAQLLGLGGPKYGYPEGVDEGALGYKLPEVINPPKEN
jgi:hypothetical protein